MSHRKLTRSRTAYARRIALIRKLYTRYDVKRGLRDLNGKGVLAGLTNIAEIRAKKVVDGKEVPDFGHLFYRGYPIEDLIGGFVSRTGSALRKWRIF